ncbi:uncharacterized protein FMAN_13709 [Fusarium mangiferae]|uniref:Uncharacterized protein n=1 Tax=Fusarium mangiferae TaxID=192010 RepID=A0A1L7TKF5_FUSMA|nr:uncharacterized protein FMAN_13709 [Fusarium mangiferae]CVK95777.1 uncharacterized protein FMAN_13709 [Fusarium mangiferae]
MDPFGRLPLEIRETIISHLYFDSDFWYLIRASPVFWHQFQTSKLLRAWDTLRKELGYHMFRQVLLLVQYPKIKESIPEHEKEDVWMMPEIDLPDPLCTPQQHLIFEMYDRYQGMLNCFALGPELVPLYRGKYPDVYNGMFSDYLVRYFGEHGENLPAVMPPIDMVGMGFRIFYFLLAIEMMEQYPSAFMTSLGEPPKQRSIKEQRSHKLVECWLRNVPGAVLSDFWRSLGLPENCGEEQDGYDNEEQEEEEEEEQKEAEEMVFIQC